MRMMLKGTVLLGCVLCAHCGDSGSSSANYTNPATAGEGGVRDGGAVSDGGIIGRLIQIETTNTLRYKPDRITAKPGEAITIQLHNSAIEDHNIEFDNINGMKMTLPKDVGNGDTGTLTFVAPTTPGNYEFFCPVDGHRALGMTRTLVVAP